ncbi:MAG: type II/IV secretion system ATPase subunit [Candidatus Aenigmatarchaeota archaeon]|nr:MAG: type II/IV secretion system ATPase subunit [Candidatus Aenigmarchaeota archaeon]
MAERKEEQVMKRYVVAADDVIATIVISMKSEDYVPHYTLSFDKLQPGTAAVLKAIREEIVRTVDITPSELLDPKMAQLVKEKFVQRSRETLASRMPTLDETTRRSLAGSLVHEMFGLGDIELLIRDDDLEEIVINASDEPMWVYHKEFGWLVTNLKLQGEEDIQNYASIVGRRVGRQISTLNPLLDAHLVTGDRVNATLFPISTKGNTLTIRKFARNPWTITHFIDPSSRTLSVDLAAFLWTCIQYELNIIIAGGTASGKTSFLNALAPFVQTNHRIVSIEDTRELQLPRFAHWVPLTTREPNPEGRGEVSMLDLMINSLRMRPDRILVGEVRRQAQAEVMFEAMHTGHSVYSTLHADNVDEMRSRLINPPINIPESQLEALHLAVVQFRHRRLGIRRTFQVAEIVPTAHIGEKREVHLNMLYRWNPSTDAVEKANSSIRTNGEISAYTGMTTKEIADEVKEKAQLLQWMLDNNIKTVNTVGKVVADYYRNKSETMEYAKRNAKPRDIFSEDLLVELRARGYMK